MTATVLVIAKAPVPGRVKTRLCPPCSPAQAARLAHAALDDTLTVVARVPATRRMLVLDGDPAGLVPAGFDVAEQRGDGLDDRLAAAFAGVDGPALLVGMDTPQLTAAQLTEGLDALRRSEAVLGPALDGGYWAVGLRDPRHAARAFPGVPMSTAQTGAAQRERLRGLGLSVAALPALRDVDTFADARAVAALAPASRFATALATLRPIPLAA